MEDEEKRGLLGELQDNVKQLMEQNEMLLQVVDKKLLAQYYAKNSKKLPKEVKLNTLGGRVVLSWLMKQNEVYKDPATQRWFEKQTVLVTLEGDGEGNEAIVEMPYTSYVKDYVQVPARVISSSKNEETEELTLKVARLSDGKEYNLDVRYVN